MLICLIWIIKIKNFTEIFYFFIFLYFKKERGVKLSGEGLNRHFEFYIFVVVLAATGISQGGFLPQREKGGRQRD